MAQELGLNIDSTQWNISPSDRNRRVRLWWAVYMQERWSAFGLGRSPNISDEYRTAPMVTMENFPSEGYRGSLMNQVSARIFVAMAELTIILSDILKNFYTIRAIIRIHALSPEEMHVVVAQFEERLSIFQREHLVPLYTADTLLDSTGTIHPVGREKASCLQCIQELYFLPSILLRSSSAAQSCAMSTEMIPTINPSVSVREVH